MDVVAVAVMDRNSAADYVDQNQADVVDEIHPQSLDLVVENLDQMAVVLLVRWLLAERRMELK